MVNGLELSAENKTMFWFCPWICALEDNTQFLYKTTNYYHKESEGAILWNDSTLAIDWPLEDVGEVLVSDKDRQAVFLNNFYNIVSSNLSVKYL
jgi:dTDP-4-dehydrorhamnose 3,5-epimerase